MPDIFIYNANKNDECNKVDFTERDHALFKIIFPECFEDHVCGVFSPDQLFMCSREPGHEGAHAGYADDLMSHRIAAIWRNAADFEKRYAKYIEEVQDD